MKMRYRYIPSIAIEEGMILGESVSISDHGFLCITLPEGHCLTQDNLRQLAAHHAKFILIAEQDSRTESQIEVDVALATRRVKEVFSGMDNTDPCTVALFEQVLAFRCA